ncbi:MAG TPA: hypothetical protein VGS57_11010 [Thermoanaerobaculia bacterium]|jgi:hypothetical protein|nr:hypothetical protein [Thermoanaerobaculia bacterium]
MMTSPSTWSLLFVLVVVLIFRREIGQKLLELTHVRCSWFEARFRQRR